MMKEYEMINNPITRNRANAITSEEYLDKYIKIIMKKKNITYEIVLSNYENVRNKVFLKLREVNPNLMISELDFFDVYFRTMFDDLAQKYLIDNYTNPRIKYVYIIKYELENENTNKISYEDVIDFERDGIPEEAKLNEYIISIKPKNKRKSRKNKSSKRRTFRVKKKSKKIYK